ncbi:MAG: hypothetical protein ACYDAI_18665, partial [Trichloromonadaceae bacterium]
MALPSSLQFLQDPKKLPKTPPAEPRPNPKQILAALGVDCSSSERLMNTLPFAGLDLSAGSESELQAVV